MAVQTEIEISSDVFHAVGLKGDGTAVATGLNKDRQCYVGGWNLLK